MVYLSTEGIETGGLIPAGHFIFFASVYREHGRFPV